MAEHSDGISRTLIAHDSGMQRQLLSEALSSRGFKVMGQSRTGPELARLVETIAPHKVVADVGPKPDRHRVHRTPGS